MENNTFKSVYSLGQYVKIKGTRIVVRIVEISFCHYSMPYLACYKYDDNDIAIWYDLYEDEVEAI